ncbi:DNA polymerase delta subunit 3 [Liparis tanakae]|uniref:DNA polymerase delta subunit 3 n=1 Tax=Liparis tanakae TaxID=230148 RepID=A0A4Z2FJ59_9TELE|nr:DNA polymerase delta subunit 3 [Liparis tanakae]
MLFHYLDHKRKESSAQLNATYLVSGKFVDNGQSSHRVSVVKEDKLEDLKAKMSLVVSVHVYSVQKALLKDSGPLYGVDYDAVRDNLEDCGRHSAIRCAGATPTRPPAPEAQRAASPEPRDHAAAVTREAGVAPKPAAKPQRGIMGMFAKRAVKTVKPDAAERQRPTTPPTSPPSPPPREKPAAAVELQQDSKKESEKESRTESSRTESSRTESRKDSSRTDSSRKDSSRSKTKRLVDSDSEEEKMEKKKRRRIKRPEPDSSDDDVIPDSPQPMETRDPTPSPKKKAEPVPRSHRGESEMKMRKRRRVLKSRTFLDDEGSIVTEKCYESESYSEAEDDVRAVKPAPRNPAAVKLPAGAKPEEKRSHKKTSAAANKGTKQASIMGFFQKK